MAFFPVLVKVTTTDVKRAPEEPTATGSASRTTGAESTDPVIRWLHDQDQGVLVEGTVSVLDAGDREHTEEDGEFTPIASSGRRGGGGRRVPVHAGRFRMHLAKGLSLGIESMVLGGRSAFVIESPTLAPSDTEVGRLNRIAIVEGEPVHVFARWTRPVVLHVVDSSSKVDLENVDVFLLAPNWRTNDFSHPGSLQSAETLVDRDRSPIALEGPPVADGTLPATRKRSNLQWQDTVRVRAPGHAWGKALVDFQKGGDTTVELAPGADLEVTLIGMIPLPPPTQTISNDQDDSVAVLRMSNSDTFAFEVPPSKSGPTRIEGLAPGSFELRLERGKFWDRPQVLGRTHVDLVAGSTTHATLTIEPPQELRRVPLAGTVRLSPKWNCTWLDLRFEPIAVPGGSSLEERGLELKDLKPVNGAPDLFRFSLLPILPGRYIVKSFAYSYLQTIETGDAGRDDVLISIGDPADVLVHALDEATNQPVRDEHLLLWNCRRPVEPTGVGLNSTKWDDERQAWSFRAPAGEIELRVALMTGLFELCEPSPFFRVNPGPNDLTIHVRHATGFMISFARDGETVAWPRGAVSKIRIESIDGQPVADSTRSEGSIMSDSGPAKRDDENLFRVPTGGTWRIIVAPLDGFDSIAPIEATVTAGEIRPVSIPLRPTR